MDLMTILLIGFALLIYLSWFRADDGHGTTVQFQSGFLAEVTSVGLKGMKRKAVDSTHMTSTDGWMTFFPSKLKDPGQLDVEIQFDPDETPPIDQDAENITVTFPVPEGGSTGATFTCEGFMTDFDVTDPNGEKMTATCTLKFSGEPTWTVST